MKYEEYYKDLLGCNNSEEVFDKLLDTLAISNRGWSYFVNWDKVLGNYQELEIDLNTMNYLVGKENIEEEYTRLVKRQPSIVRTTPILLALRDVTLDVMTNHTEGNLQYEHFSFRGNDISDEQIQKSLTFLKESGLLELIKNQTIKSIPDYVFGIEVGLDSNGRKNRGGDIMEIIVGGLLQKICESNDYLWMNQATSKAISADWKKTIEVDKTSRRFDFAVLANDQLFLIETNFYGGGGSKLKATAGEYKTLFDFLDKQGHTFIWITDGLGWKTTVAPLEETFNHIDYLLNLKFVSLGLLKKIFTF